MDEKTLSLIKSRCACYIPSKELLNDKVKLPEGVTEPQPPYCMAPLTWQELAVSSTFDDCRKPSILSVRSCYGTNCELKKALGLSE